MTNIFNRQGLRQVGQAVAAGLGAGSHPRLSIEGGQFTLVDAANNRWGAPTFQIRDAQNFNRTALNVIIIDANPVMSKLYYPPGAYNPNNPTPPLCFSDNGVAPSRNAGQPMARTCTECTLSMWNSAVNPQTLKGTKACKDKKKVAVLVVGDPTGLAFELQVPPASLKALGAFQAMCAASQIPGGGRPADVSDFVCQISFVPNVVSELEFEPIAWLNSVVYDGQNSYLAMDQQGQLLVSNDGGAGIAGLIDKIWDAGVTEELVGKKDQPISALPAQVAPAGYIPAATAPAPAPAPVLPAPQPQSHYPVAQPQPQFQQPQYQPPANPPAYGNPAPANPYAGPAGAAPAQPVHAFPQAGQPAPQAQQSTPPVRKPRAPRTTPAARAPAPAPVAVQQEPQAQQAPQQQVLPPMPDLPSRVPEFIQRRQQQSAPPVDAGAPQNSGAPAPRSAAGLADMGAPPADIADQIARAMAHAPGS